MPRKTYGIEFEIHPSLWKECESRRWLLAPAPKYFSMSPAAMVKGEAKV